MATPAGENASSAHLVVESGHDQRRIDGKEHLAELEVCGRCGSASCGLQMRHPQLTLGPGVELVSGGEVGRRGDVHRQSGLGEKDAGIVGVGLIQPAVTARGEQRGSARTTERESLPADGHRVHDERTIVQLDKRCCFMACSVSAALTQSQERSSLRALAQHAPVAFSTPSFSFHPPKRRSWYVTSTVLKSIPLCTKPRRARVVAGEKKGAETPARATRS